MTVNVVLLERLDSRADRDARKVGVGPEAFPLHKVRKRGRRHVESKMERKKGRNRAGRGEKQTEEEGGRESVR
jgi:hypothetical protein